ncbi:MAG: cache domain-containing protein [Thermodesulfobacteriota bacterium]
MLATLPSSAASARFEAAKIILPAVLAVLLFTVALVGLLLPAFENGLLEKKKESCRDLTGLGLGVLAYFANLADGGAMPLGEAQGRARTLLRGLRHGAEGKGYLWVNDLRPVMIMHPYRPDLEGQDLSGYRDKAGRPVFQAFVDQVQRQGAGYVPYLWQWQDRPGAEEAKLSHVRLFAPWGWVVGTGVYLGDVEKEAAAVFHKALGLAVAILAAVSLLAAYLVRQGLRLNARRQRAEEALLRHQEELESQVQVRTADLAQALAEVKRLSGLLPICASCKKIRDDSGSWQQLEVYIRDRSEARFSHGICPDCAWQLYPELMAARQQSRQTAKPSPAEPAGREH